jgi:DNA-directed RNA polymerase specialized sigma24 family protein
MSAVDGLIDFADWDELWQVAYRTARAAKAGSHAEDIAQETAIAASQHVARGHCVNPSWVRARAFSRTQDCWRDKQRRHEAEEVYEEQRAARQRPVWIRTHPAFGELVLQVKALLLLLDDDVQDVINHLYFYAYSVKETRARLHLSLARLNALRARGLKELRRLAGVADR